MTVGIGLFIMALCATIGGIIVYYASDKDETILWVGIFFGGLIGSCIFIFSIIPLEEMIALLNEPLH